VLTPLLFATPRPTASPNGVRLLRVAGTANRLRLTSSLSRDPGSTFRPDYRALGFFRVQFPDIPIMALTASATAGVQEDIIASLKLSREHLFKCVMPFNRKNLFYEVRIVGSQDPTRRRRQPLLPRSQVRYRSTYAEADQNRLADLASFILSMQRRAPVVQATDGSDIQQPVSGIVYARTKAACTSIADYLRTKQIRAQPYHKGLSSGTLGKTMRAWTGAKPPRKTGEQTKLGKYFGGPSLVEDGERVDVVCATSTSHALSSCSCNSSADLTLRARFSRFWHGERPPAFSGPLEGDR
jgi:hypothetical protein